MMANNKTKKPVPNNQPAQNMSLKKPVETGKKPSFKLEITALPGLTPYLPGILLFLIALLIGLLTYQDYGISWDEAISRNNGILSFDYIFNNDESLLIYKDRQYGVGFELVLVFLERWMKLKDTRDVFLMRHLVTHIFFLISVLAGYILIRKKM